MTGATDQILNHSSRSEAIEQVNRALDMINYKLYLFSEHYLGNEAYMDTYSYYAQLQLAYINLLKELEG